MLVFIHMPGVIRTRKRIEIRAIKSHPRDISANHASGGRSLPVHPTLMEESSVGYCVDHSTGVKKGVIDRPNV